MLVKALEIVGAARTSVERYTRELILTVLEVELNCRAVADASLLDVDPQSLNSVQRLPSKEGLLGLAVQQVTMCTHDEVEAFQQLVAGRNEPVLCDRWSVMGRGWRCVWLRYHVST